MPSRPLLLVPRRTMLRALGVATVMAIAFCSGGYAGAMRTWPLRHPIKLLERTGKPVPAPLREVAIDGNLRLIRYPGKTALPCPPQDARTAVILVTGQSNAANSGGERIETRPDPRIVNWHQGRCSVAATPLLGASGTSGEPWTPMAERLLEQGAFDQIVLAPLAVGGTAVSEWTPGGRLFPSTQLALRELAQRYRVTHVLWVQGESDANGGTAGAAYRSAFLGFADALREEGILAPVYVARATRCGPLFDAANPIRAAQRDLVGARPWILAGIDVDLLLQREDRYDDCHFGGTGLRKMAEAWAQLLGNPPVATLLPPGAP